MKLDARSIGLVIAGAILAIATVWIHYEVKAKLAPVAGLGLGLDGMSGGYSKFEIGDQIPDFKSSTLHGGSIALSDFRDQQVVVLDFWATWCTPCVKGMPALQEMHEEFGGRGVKVLAVNVGEDAETVQEFIDREGYSFDVVMDPFDDISDAFGVGGIPQLFIVDKSGHLQFSKVGGAVSSAQAKAQANKLGALLEKLLQEVPTAASS